MNRNLECVGCLLIACFFVAVAAFVAGMTYATDESHRLAIKANVGWYGDDGMFHYGWNMTGK
jgi:hypothetical protein